VSSEGGAASGTAECPWREERLGERLDTCHDLAEGQNPTPLHKDFSLPKIPF